MLNFVLEIEDEVERISEADVNRATVKLNKRDDKERVIGVVDSETARYYAVSLKLAYRAMKMKLEAEEAGNDASHEYYRVAKLAEAARELFWSQSRLDVGEEVIQDANIGVRRGWELVTWADAPGSSALAKLLGLGE